MKKTFVVILSSIVLLLGITGCFGGSKSETPENRLERALEELSVPSTISEDIVLPSVSDTNINLVWESSDESILTSSGKVYRYETDKTVILTASVSLSGVNREKEFTVTVPKITELDIVDPDDEIGTEYKLLGVLQGTTTEGYYFETNGNMYYILSNEVPSIIGQKMLVNIKKSENEGIFAVYNELSKEIYTTVVEEIDFGEVEDVNFYTQMDFEDSANYYQKVYTKGVVEITENEVYITQDGSDKIKISSKTPSAVIEHIKSFEYKDTNEYEVVLKGFLNTYADGVWEVTISTNDFIAADLTSDAKKMNIIFQYAIKAIPTYIEREVERINLPDTHPIYGGIITWNLEGTNESISEEGLVTTAADDQNIAISFTVTFNGAARSTEINSVIEGNVDNIIDMMNEEIYNEAVCSSDQLPGEGCWNTSGVYVYEDKFNVKGIVVNVGASFILLKDLVEEVYIPIFVPLYSVYYDKNVGDILFFEGAGLRTNGYALEVYGGAYIPSKSTLGGPAPDINYTPINYQDFKNLDPKAFSTYEKLYQVEKAFTCSNERLDYFLIMEDTTNNCDANLDNTYIIDETTRSSLVEYELRGDNNSPGIAASETRNTYISMKVLYRGERTLLRKQMIDKVEETLVNTRKVELYSLDYVEFPTLTAEEEKAVYDFFIREKMLYLQETDKTNMYLRMYDNIKGNESAAYDITNWAFNTDIRLVTGESSITCNLERFCPTDKYANLKHYDTNENITPGYVVFNAGPEGSGLFFIQYFSDKLKQFVVDPLNNYPEDGNPANPNNSGKLNYGENAPDGEVMQFTITVKYQVYVDDAPTGEFIEHTITKSVNPAADAGGR